MNEHFSCLDMLRVRWTSESGRQETDCGTLLEIWQSGGTLHTDRPIPQGTRVSIACETGQIEAEISGFERDEFGYYSELKVTREWFPELYHPAYLSASTQHSIPA